MTLFVNKEENLYYNNTILNVYGETEKIALVFIHHHIQKEIPRLQKNTEEDKILLSSFALLLKLQDTRVFTFDINYAPTNEVFRQKMCLKMIITTAIIFRFNARILHRICFVHFSRKSYFQSFKNIHPSYLLSFIV